MRYALALSALLLASTSAPHAQGVFRLVDPVLTVDGRRVGTVGTPLVQEPFGTLVLTVPGAGTYRVSATPFEGARPSGQFEGSGLFFAVAGRSVRLRSSAPMLDARGARTAYIRLDPVPYPTRRTEGLARLAVADGLDGRGQRSVPTTTWTSTAPSGPRPGTASVATDELRADVVRLRAEVARLADDRRRLTAERDGLLARPAPDAEAVRALSADRDRIAQERDDLARARTQAEADRARLLQQLAEMNSRPAPGASQRELSDLRTRLAARDRALDVLRDERDDRDRQLRQTESALAAVRADLTRAEADRDQAVLSRDAALTSLDRMAATVAEAERTVAERDRLRLERDQLASERDLAYRQRDELLAAQTTFEADRAALDAARREQGLDRDALAQEQLDLLEDRSRLIGERDALRAERDALADALRAERDESEALRAQLASSAFPPDLPPPPAAPASDRDGAMAFLPGFDFGRLANPDVVRRKLDEVEYPRWATVGRIEGDVLVLFQTDREGRVIRTAVPTPIGGGLDGLAEDLVREMRFTPPTVDGQPTGLRSQLTVRFEL